MAIIEISLIVGMVGSAICSSRYKEKAKHARSKSEEKNKQG